MMLDIVERVNLWMKEGRNIALATVVETWGSAPRRAGSKMAVTDALAMAGSVSGGCVETAVVEQAAEVLASGGTRLLTFGVSDDTAWQVGLSCGGRISIFVEKLDSAWWERATAAALQDRPAVTLTVLEGEQAGRKLLVDGHGRAQYATLDSSFHDMLAEVALRQTLSGRHEIDGMNVLIDVHRPRPHLILIGGVHVAQPLHHFARHLGFRVSVVDPRGVFASPERFPAADTIVYSYPDKALPQLGLDADTYIAVLTHDPKIDDKALITALPSPTPYVGVLSSKRTHETRVKRLQHAGLTPEQIARIHTPIGVDIAARTPEEIALSIMAEVVAVRNRVQAAQPALKAAL